MKTAAELLLASKIVTAHRGATRAEIKRLKGLTSIQLPSDYVEYLEKCGWVEVGDDVIYGLGEDATDDVSVLEVKIFEGVAEPSLRSTLVPLMADGGGNHYCLDVDDIGAVKTSTCPVVLWDHEDPDLEMQECEIVAKTFRAWIVRLIYEAEQLHG